MQPPEHPADDSVVAVMVHSRCRAADSVLRRVEHRLSHVDRVIRDDLDAAAVPDSHLLIDQRGDGDGIVHGLAIAEGNEQFQ